MGAFCQPCRLFDTLLICSWVGLYLKDACPDDDDTAPHMCYKASRPIPSTEISGSIEFYMKDYLQAGTIWLDTLVISFKLLLLPGWFDLRYFAGDGGGNVCEVRAHHRIIRSAYSTRCAS